MGRSQRGKKGKKGKGREQLLRTMLGSRGTSENLRAAGGRDPLPSGPRKEQRGRWSRTKNGIPGKKKEGKLSGVRGGRCIGKAFSIIKEGKKMSG